MNHEGHEEHEEDYEKGDRLKVKREALEDESKLAYFRPQALSHLSRWISSGHPALRGYLSDLYVCESESMKLVSCLCLSAFICG